MKQNCGVSQDCVGSGSVTRSLSDVPAIKEAEIHHYKSIGADSEQSQSGLMEWRLYFDSSLQRARIRAQRTLAVHEKSFGPGIDGKAYIMSDLSVSMRLPLASPF